MPDTPFQVPRALVEFVLLGPEDDRRQLQDSPILGDVWVEYAKNPKKPLQLLITPFKDHAAAKLASELTDHLRNDGVKGADVAYLQGLVAAKLTFQQVLEFLVPMSRWWVDRRTSEGIDRYRDSL